MVLERDDPYVLRELGRRRERTRPASTGTPSWKDLHDKEYRTHKLSFGAGADRGAAKSQCWATLTDREKEVLDFSLQVHGDRLMHNLSQQIHRVIVSGRPEKSKHVVPTQLPSQILWVAGGHNRLLLGREALLYLGFPVAKARRRSYQ